MKRSTALLAGIGIGAGTMYYSDPRIGRRRRAELGDRMNHMQHQAVHSFNLSSVDFVNRTQGTFSQVRSLFKRFREVPDSVIEARIRSILGRYVSHPHVIHVNVNRGHTVLSGLLLAHELEPVLENVARVAGVRHLENRLETHSREDHLSSLQGGKPRTGKHIDILQMNWAPATRVIMGALGSSLGVYGLRRKDIWGTIATGIGAMTLMRSITNTEVKRLLGLKGAKAITFHKTMHINAPIDTLFDYWKNFRNFPEFISEVKDVQVLDNGNSHWILQGPLSLPVHWKAQITRLEKNRIIAWKSSPDSTVQLACRVRFFENHSGTKMEIDVSYLPAAGILGHSLVKLFGSNPKARLDSCMMQMKQKIESSVPTEQKFLKGLS